MNSATISTSLSAAKLGVRMKPSPLKFSSTNQALSFSDIFHNNITVISGIFYK